MATGQRRATGAPLRCWMAPSQRVPSLSLSLSPQRGEGGGLGIFTSPGPRHERQRAPDTAREFARKTKEPLSNQNFIHPSDLGSSPSSPPPSPPPPPPPTPLFHWHHPSRAGAKPQYAINLCWGAGIATYWPCGRRRSVPRLRSAGALTASPTRVSAHLPHDRYGTVRPGTAWPGTARHGPARHGTAWPGTARPGTARFLAVVKQRRLYLSGAGSDARWEDAAPGDASPGPLGDERRFSSLGEGGGRGFCPETFCNFVVVMKLSRHNCGESR